MDDLIKETESLQQSLEGLAQKFPGVGAADLEKVKQELKELRERKRTGQSKDDQLRVQSAKLGRLSAALGKAKKDLEGAKQAREAAEVEERKAATKVDELEKVHKETQEEVAKLTQGAAAPQPQHKLPGWDETAASMARLKQKMGTEDGGAQDFTLIENLIAGLKHIIAAAPRPEQAEGAEEQAKGTGGDGGLAMEEDDDGGWSS